MTIRERLNLLKLDLGFSSSAMDELLLLQLRQAEAAIKREGIVLQDNWEDNSLQISYAAYLYRKRAGEQTAMPRFLRRMLNDRLFSQKMRTEDDS